MKKISFCILVACIACFSNAYSQKATARINHLAIFVKDMKQTNFFYQKIIGLDTIPEPFHDGKHTWLKIGPGSSLHIIEGASEKKEYFKNNHICFSVPSLEKFVESLRTNNFTWEDAGGKKAAITTRVDGVKQIWLQDPDGYWIEINDAKD
ncbi:MAG: VOC family protein [Chitinophagaceae bacterium]|nr:VOC family protein [Chitinophagaceae bacterium]